MFSKAVLIFRSFLGDWDHYGISEFLFVRMAVASPMLVLSKPFAGG
jgi:hypothetical protein